MRLPAKYRSIKNRVFKTELEALNALKQFHCKNCGITDSEKIEDLAGTAFLCKLCGEFK